MFEQVDIQRQRSLRQIGVEQDTMLRADLGNRVEIRNSAVFIVHTNDRYECRLFVNESF